MTAIVADRLMPQIKVSSSGRRKITLDRDSNLDRNKEYKKWQTYT